MARESSTSTGWGRSPLLNRRVRLVRRLNEFPLDVRPGDPGLRARDRALDGAAAYCFWRLCVPCTLYSPINCPVWESVTRQIAVPEGDILLPETVAVRRD